MTDDRRIIEWLTLSLTPGLGSAACRQLVGHFGSPGRALAASRDELDQIAGLRRPARQAVGQHEWRQAAQTTWEKTQAAGQSLICWDDPAYPAQLRTIHDPPVLLYVKGNTAALSQPALAVVGARAATTYGRQMAERFAGDLARRGFTVVSGMALGIDSAAHAGALAAGGQTLAVLGCGLDIVYPASNRRLYDRIAATGALVSEYPPGTPPDGFRFPARNRIISGLSLGVIVIEAARHSGSLITAHLALDQGREVFAMPGRIDSGKSEGSHRLLQEGAKLIHSVADILEELPQTLARPAGDKSAPDAAVPPEPATPLLEPEARTVLAALDAYPQSIDAIIVATAMPAAVVAEKLLLLELNGLVEALPGSQYRLKNGPPAVDP